MVWQGTDRVKSVFAKYHIFFIPYTLYQCCGDPELLPESGSGTIVPDPDPANNERADK